VRSLERAAFSALFDPAVVRESDREVARPWAWHWHTWASAAILRGYLTTAAGARFMPENRREIGLLLDAFVLERALRDLGDALEYDPTGVALSLEGLERLLGQTAGRSSNDAGR
jgi:maltose alpha-D-glucosyltransferase/alpha-amylase